MRSLMGVCLLFAALATTLPAQEKSLVVVIDQSGSMEKLERMLWARRAVEGIIASADAGSRLGLIAFDDHVRELTKGLLEIPSGPEGHRLRRDLIKIVHSLRPGGATDILGAMERAIATGAQEIVLATDGMQTQDYGGRAAAAVEVEKVVRAQLSRGAPGVRVFAIGMGAEADPTILRAYATASDGAFFQVQDATHLLDTFTEIGRLITGAFVCDGSAVSIFPGDRRLKLFMDGSGGVSQAPRLVGPAGEFVLEDGPGLFAADVGPVRIFNIEQCPPAGAYVVRRSGGGVRILTEKRAPYRFVLAPVRDVRSNALLEIVARIERLEQGTVLPGKGEVTFEIRFDQGERDHAAPLAGPFVMERTTEDTFVWRGFLRRSENPEGTYNVRLVGEVSGWKAADAAAFRVLPALPLARISAPADVRTCAPGERIEIAFGIEREHWPAGLALRADASPAVVIDPGSQRWSWSFVAPTQSGEQVVELTFTAPGAVLNGQVGAWTFRARLNVVDPEVVVRFPQGHEFGSVPAMLPFEVLVPQGSGQIRMRVVVAPPDEVPAVTLHDEHGAALVPEVSLVPGVTRLALHTDAPLSCPAGPFQRTLRFAIEPSGFRVRIDGQKTEDVTVTGKVAPIDVPAVLIAGKGETLTGIQMQLRTADERASAAFEVHLGAGEAAAGPDLASGLGLDLELPALRLRVVESGATTVRFATDMVPGVTPGVHRGTLRVRHASPRVHVTPDSWPVELHVPQPELTVSVLRDGHPVEAPIELWAPLLADLGAAPVVARLVGLRLRLALRGADSVVVRVGAVRARAVDDSRTVEPDQEPLTLHGTPLDLELPELPITALGGWRVEVPLDAGAAATLAAGGLACEGGKIVLPVRLRRVPLRETAGGLVALLALLYAVLRARNPGARVTLKLLKAPEGGYLVLPTGLLRPGESALVRGGHVLRRRSIHMGPGSRVSPGRGDNGGGRLLLSRRRKDHWLHRRAGSADRVFIRRGGTRLTDASLLLRDGDVLALGAYEIEFKMASRRMRAAVRPPTTSLARPAALRAPARVGQGSEAVRVPNSVWAILSRRRRLATGTVVNAWQPGASTAEAP